MIIRDYSDGFFSDLSPLVLALARVLHKDVQCVLVTERQAILRLGKHTQTYKPPTTTDIAQITLGQNRLAPKKQKRVIAAYLVL